MVEVVKVKRSVIAIVLRNYSFPDEFLVRQSVWHS